MKLLYFGLVRSRIGVSGEELDPPPEVGDVNALIDWLRARSPKHAQAFDDISALRVAVNQELTTLDAAISAGDEVALFPPMTGG